MVQTIERRTAIDAVYDVLHEEIVTLKLLPGAKLSEADIASRFGVSRQPVRDAFNRLESKQLLLIRPQKATVVRGFSLTEIAHARFVRLAVEVEVLRAACAIWNSDRADELRKNLCLQQSAVADEDAAEFHKLDYLFHKMVCELAGHPLAFETIEDCKRSVDRLCVLGFGRKNEAVALLQDHEDIALALGQRDAEQATQAARRHFARLDGTIIEIHKMHAEFFEDADSNGFAQLTK